MCTTKNKTDKKRSASAHDVRTAGVGIVVYSSFVSRRRL